MGDISYTILGLIIMIIGIINVSGNISTIHWYNRTKVMPQDEKKYGRVIGIGTLVIGSFITLSGVLNILFENDMFMLLLLLGAIIGLIIIIYGQFKYNKGIF